MHKQHQHTIHLMQSSNVSSRETATATVEQKLGQLQAQFRAMPAPGSAEYRFSLSATRHFAQDVVVELVAWLHETETHASTTGR